MSIAATVRARSLVVLLGAGACFLPSAAIADGAFPDSNTLVLPSDRPNEIIVATNFGEIFSEDNGGSWSYVCEQAMLAYCSGCGSLFGVGPAPADRLFAVSLADSQNPTGFSYSADDGCSWDAGQSPGYSLGALDAFPDPSDPLHILLNADVIDGGVIATNVFESHNGGATFDNSLYSVPTGTSLTGVEIASSPPTTYYLTGFQNTANGFVPFLARSANAGVSWQRFDLSAALGNQIIRLIAVDPTNANTVYLRAENGLAVVTNGGSTVSFAFDGGQSGIDAFLRLSNGSWLLSSNGYSFISTDQGQTWDCWANGAGIRNFAERDGGLYVLTNCSAVAVTWDLGATWTPLMVPPLGTSFGEISGPRQCNNIPAACSGDWAMNEQRFEESETNSCVDGVVFFGDAGVGGCGGMTGNPDAGTSPGGPDASSPSDGGSGAPSSNSCGCTELDATLAVIAVVALAAFAKKKRRPALPTHVTR
jgi:hypothetical protein